MSICLSVSLPDCMSVCLCVNQCITNHKRCTYRLAMNPAVVSPQTFFSGIFPPQQFPPDIPPGHFPRTNSLPGKFPPLIERHYVCGRISCKPNSHKRRYFLALQHGSSQRQITKALKAPMSKQFTRNANGYLQILLRQLYSALSGQLYLLLPFWSCRKV